MVVANLLGNYPLLNPIGQGMLFSLCVSPQNEGVGYCWFSEKIE